MVCALYWSPGGATPVEIASSSGNSCKGAAGPVQGVQTGIPMSEAAASKTPAALWSEKMYSVFSSARCLSCRYGASGSFMITLRPGTRTLTMLLWYI